MKAGCSGDSIAFAGVSDTLSCSHGSDRPSSPRQPIHLVAWRDRPRSRQGWWGQDESARGRSRHRGVLRRWVSVSNEESLFVVCRARSFSVLWAAYAVVLGRVKQNRCVQDTPGIGKVDRNRGRAHARRDAQLYLVQSPAPRPAVAASGCLFGTCKAATLPKSETGLPSFSRNRSGGCTDVS